MKIGAQMYTVREHTQTAKDFENTIKKLAAIGYDCVQVSGIGPIPAREVADICKASNMEIIITHTNPDRVKDETNTVIDEHRIMGASYIGIGGMPGCYTRNTEGVSQFIADFTPVVEKIHACGMMFMYHNHAYEFEKYGQKLMIQHLIDELPLAGFTIDTYWVQAGGADPCAWIKALKGRVDVLHIKDMAWANEQQLMAEVMEGNLNWDGIFAASREAGVKYAMVEQDDCYGHDPFDCLKKSLVNVQEFLHKS